MDSSGDRLIGKVIRDRYVVLRLLGRGGMGSVYAVKDTQSNVERALKVLDSGQGGVRIAQHRFKREFSTISRLSHPHVVGVFDFGEADGTPFYVMELLGGAALTTLVPKPGEPPDKAGVLERVKALTGVVDALGYVHQQHLVHRDLKPSNLIFGEDGKLKITDFGLAKDFDNAITLTESGAILGTLTHMAPEQLQGRRIDHRADLYALGIIFYQVLTGRLPFTESNPLALMRQQVTQVALAPGRHNPAVPRGLDDVVLKLLQRDPVDRYANSQVLLSDLESVLHGEEPSGARGPGSSSDLRTVLSVAAGFVGRQDELLRMQKALERTGAGEGGVALVTGEPGSGKTRFVEEFCSRGLLFGISVLKGRADRRAGVFYRPFIEMIEGYNARIGQYDAEAEAGLFADIGKVLSRLVPRLLERPSVAKQAEPAALDPAENKVRLFDAVTRFFLRIARQETLVLFFDDFQHVDELSLELFQYLGRNAREARILLVAACRGEELKGRTHPVEAAILALRRERVPCEGVALRRLTQPETERMASGLAPGKSLGSDVLSRLWERTAGVPYFVEELMRWLRDQGALDRGTWPEEMPETVEAVLRERIEGISEDVLAVLRSASVIGEEFEFEILLRVHGGEEGALLEVIDAGLHANVLKERPGERYAFVHPLLRLMLYSKLLPRKRRLMHQTVAKSIEGRGVTDARASAEALAYHWASAGDKDKALSHQIEAGRKAFAAHANDAAREHLQAAAKALEEKADPASQGKLFEVLDELWEVLMVAGPADEARRVGERMVVLAGMLADPERRAKAHYKLGRAELQAGSNQAALGHLKAASEEAQSPALKAISLGVLGFLHAEKLGRPLDGLPIAEQAIKALAGVNDPTARFQAMNALGVALLRAGRLADAEQRMRATVEQMRAAGRRVAECNALNNLSVTLSAMGKHEEQNDVLRKALDLARSIGYLTGECLYTASLAAALADQESPDAEGTAKRSLELSRRAGFRSSIGNALQILAQLAFKNGEIEECRKHLVDLLEDPEFNPGSRVGAQLLDSEALMRLGKDDEALARLEAMESKMGPYRDSVWWSEFRVGHAGLLLDAGRLDAAAAILAETEAPLAKTEMKELSASFRFQQARLAAARGDAARALELFKASTPVLLGSRNAMSRAMTRASFAVSMEALGRKGEARSAWLRAEEDMLKAGLQAGWQSFARRHPKMAALMASVEAEARTEVRAAPPSALLAEAPPLVGRDGEMEWLIGRLREASEKKAGHCVIYRGPTGIGKTRLLREFATSAAHGGTQAFVGLAREENRATAHFPFVEIVRQALECLPRARIAADLASALRGGIPELADHPSLAAGASPAPRADLQPEQERLRVHDAVARLLEAVAAGGGGGDRTGLAVVLDDAGAADDSSLDLLAYLARAIRHHPILVLASYNTDETAATHPAARLATELGRSREATVRELGPLQPADVVRLVETQVGQGRRDVTALAALVSEKSGGNPLFARELLLAMFRNGLVEDRGDGYRLKTSSVRLPDTIADLLRHQIENLPPESLRLLGAASVLGREFEFDTLMEVTGLDEEPLLDRLEGLVRSALLEAVANDPLGRDLYRFQAPQMREVVYSGVEKDERAKMHLRAAESLERAALSRKGASAGELAHHFVLAGAGKKARDWSLEAGRRAARVCANAQAEHHLSHAVGVMKRDATQMDRAKMFEAHSELAQVRMRVGDNEGAREACEEAIAAAATPAERARVRRAMAQSAHRAGNLKEAVRLCTEAAQALCREAFRSADAADVLDMLPKSVEAAPEAAEPLVGLISLIAFDLSYLGERDRCAKLASAAQKIAESSGRPEIQATAAKTEGFVRQEEGKTKEARAAYEKALGFHRASGHRWNEAALLNNLAGVETASGNIRKGLDLYVQSARMFGEAGDLVEHGRQLTNIGRAQLDLGEWKEAEVTLVQARDLNVRLSEKRSICFAQLDLARLHAARDDRDKAAPALAEAARVAEDLGYVGLMLGAMRLQADLCRREGNLAGAREHHRRAIALARSRNLATAAAAEALDAVQTETQAGDLAAAEGLLGEARAALSAGEGEERTAILRAEALCLEARGNFAKAAELYGQIALSVAQSQNPLTVALAELDLGRALAKAASRQTAAESARPHLAKARATFDKLGAKGSREQADAVLATLPA